MSYLPIILRVRCTVPGVPLFGGSGSEQFGANVEIDFKPQPEKWVLSGVSFRDVMNRLEACLDTMRDCRVVGGFDPRPTGDPLTQRDIAETIAAEVYKMIRMGYVRATGVEVDA